MTRKLLELATPPKVLEVVVGDEIAVHWSFLYQGPSYRETVYVAVYEGDWPRVDEKLKAYDGVSLPDAREQPFRIHSAQPYILAPKVYSGMLGKSFGIYLKVGNNLPEEGVGAFDNVIKVVKEAPPPPPPPLINFGLTVSNIPSYLQPITYWSLTWQGVEYGKWTAIDRGILLSNVKSTGQFILKLLNQAAPRIDTITTATYTLEDRGLYNYNVGYGTLTGGKP